ncbi:site-specific integrase [Lactiplantibacillus herbarum]|uniref:site-specific integrase n=1 Tax=Lactiplantibacillus herbarum TaxID=1670446 RepID=UPI00069F678C|nr:site-specific integrase [Lactiplantibacillus herbarum]
MENLLRNQIQQFLNKLDLSHETARKDLMHIRACLRDAVSDGVIPRNPVDDRLYIVADPNRTKSDDKKFMSIADYKKVRDFLLGYHYYLADVNRLALLIISQSGLRAGECIALKYEDLDFLHKTIRVDESWDSYHSMIKEPKTKNAKRILPIPPKVMKILEGWIHYHRKVLFRNGIANPDHFLLYK